MKTRHLLQISAIVTLLIIAYIFGYYRATKNTVFFLSTNNANSSIATLKYLEKNELGKIRSLHTSTLEGDIEGIKTAIKLDGYQINNFRILYAYHKFFQINESEKDRISSSIFTKYEDYKQ